ncbi:Penicillin-binding protein PbpB [Maioricimonas rarisocia]|uniref:Penicillin-binding protein PbpB n=1 Tax=Maioricimonas rarisocia TaxID=2528026 RepID=A0A517Z2T6_9PLAN|nr:penicillin-binding transpeptidase domain-containing protein [Maioricimonas rarisocia]QDU36758.1 Penicillin-binding protein PbpB [Maioricimonas rarisocia]
MRNRPETPLAMPPASPRWNVDHAPQFRLRTLLVLLGLVLSVVAGRLVHLQTRIPEQFTEVWDRTYESFEPIPSRDGRILTADGQILAFDEPRFDVSVHYRWLEDPPDERWLKQTVRSRLPRHQRRDPEHIRQMTETVLAQRQQMWSELAYVTGLSDDEFDRRRRLIQRRVERILEHVRQRRAATAESESVETEPESQRPWWEAGWDSVVEELTTPPRRDLESPLIIREQLDYHRIAEHVPVEVVSVIESHPSRFPEVRIERATERLYPGNDLAAHLIGRRQPVTAEEIEARRERFPEGDPLDYEVGDRIGRSGIERAYDRHLRGLRGMRRLTRNRQGETIDTETVREPTDGQDVILTIDSGLQQQAEQILDRVIVPAGQAPEASGADAEAPPPVGGCIVALDVSTGEILAAATAPRHDAGALGRGDLESWTAALNDPRRPFFPRLTQMAVAPGSVFKTLTAIAMIESGIDPEAPLHCRGYLDQPDRNRCLIYRRYGVGHGDVTLSDALCQSCNVYFFDSARRMGPEAIAMWSRRFGLGEATQHDLPNESGGNVPSPDEAARSGKTWYPGSTLQLAIGQATLTTTPLQVARMMAAIANDGYLVTPRFVRDVSATPADQPAGGDVQLASYESTRTTLRERIPGLSPGTLARVREGMRMVVEHHRGTGRNIALDDVAIAGKTGTAEAGGGLPDHAWFAGYVPADRPRVAFVVVLEHGGSGSRAAGPLARELVQALLDRGFIQGGR